MKLFVFPMHLNSNNNQDNIFTLRLPNRLISAGLKPVLSRTEKSCIESYYYVKRKRPRVASLQNSIRKKIKFYGHINFTIFKWSFLSFIEALKRHFTFFKKI